MVKLNKGELIGMAVLIVIFASGQIFSLQGQITGGGAATIAGWTSGACEEVCVNADPNTVANVCWKEFSFPTDCQEVNDHVAACPDGNCGGTTAHFDTLGGACYPNPANTFAASEAGFITTAIDGQNFATTDVFYINADPSGVEGDIREFWTSAIIDFCSGKGAEESWTTTFAAYHGNPQQLQDFLAGPAPPPAGGGPAPPAAPAPPPAQMTFEDAAEEAPAVEQVLSSQAILALIIGILVLVGISGVRS